YQPWTTLVVHTRGDAEPMIARVRAEIHSLDPDLAVFGVQTMSTYLKRALNLAEIEFYLAQTYGAIALLLAAIGIYGVVAFAAAQRTREIGIRMALGATPRHVLQLILGQSGRLAAIGIAIGVVAMLGLSRVLATVLYGISPTDIRAYTAAPVLLAVIALAAGYLPARRATKVDPMVALRY